MDLIKIKQFVGCIPIIYGKDCGEYAEEIKALLGNRGRIITILPVNGRLFVALDGERYLYHTVVRIVINGIAYILDRFSPNLVYEEVEYRSYLEHINVNLKFRTINGGYNL